MSEAHFRQYHWHIQADLYTSLLRQIVLHKLSHDVQLVSSDVRLCVSCCPTPPPCCCAISDAQTVLTLTGRGLGGDAARSSTGHATAALEALQIAEAHLCAGRPRNGWLQLTRNSAGALPKVHQRWVASAALPAEDALQADTDDLVITDAAAEVGPAWCWLVRSSEAMSSTCCTILAFK